MNTGIKDGKLVIDMAEADAALEWARCTSFPELVSQEDIDREQYGSMRMLVWVIITTAMGWASLVLWWIL